MCNIFISKIIPKMYFSYSDDYVLEDLELTVADYVQRAMKANFAAAWEELGATNESPVVRAAKRYTVGVFGLVTYLDARLVALVAPRYDVSAACVVSSSSARSRAVEVP